MITGLGGRTAAYVAGRCCNRHPKTPTAGLLVRSMVPVSVH
jgi:hypothetical protein